MKKLLLAIAFCGAVASQASALTLEEICKTYTYTGEIVDDAASAYGTPVFPDVKTTTVDGWTLSMLTGTMTITAAEGNNVTVTGLFPGAMTLTATFDPTDQTLTFAAKQKAVKCGSKTLRFCTGEVTYDDAGYPLVDPQDVVATFDDKGVLTIEDWIVYDSGYLEPYAYYGYTVYTPSTGEGEENGIGSVTAPTNVPVEYFNLQGMRVANPTSGLYIRRQGNTATKVQL